MDTGAREINARAEVYIEMEIEVATRRNPNYSSVLTRLGVLAAFELAAKMDKNKQKRFATALSKEIDEINDAYGGNCALGVEEVERIAQKLK